MTKDLSFYNFVSPNPKLGNSDAIDGRFKANKSRFINHANDGQENLESRTEESKGIKHIVLYATRNIKEGEELFFNYDNNGDLFRDHR